MKRINARMIARGLVAVGLLLGAVALFSAYAESQGSTVRRTACDHEIRVEGQPRS